MIPLAPYHLSSQLILPRHSVIRQALALILCLGANNLAQGAPTFGMPVACKVGTECFVQNYVDQDAGSSAIDHRCGGQTYDGHKGTDIRLLNTSAMTKGVNVMAAAKGKVKAVRDGVPDRSIRETGTTHLAGKECGNGVVIEHGTGWVSQYCHMKKGSIRVKPGASVKAGTVLGHVGLSGFTEFAHLHFEVRKGKEVIDPFTAAATSAKRKLNCAPSSSLWNARARNSLAYKPVTLVSAAFASAPPSITDIEMQEPERPTSVSPNLIAYVRVLGLRSGDEETLTVTDPLNESFATNGPSTVAKSKAQWLLYAGKRRTAPSWPLGNYKASYTLRRDGKMLIEKEFSFSLVR